MAASGEKQSGVVAKGRSGRGLSPSAHIVILAAAFIIGGPLNGVLGGWGLPAGVAIIAVFFPIFYWRFCWKRSSFWAAITLVVAAQVPFAMLMRPLLQRDRASYLLVFLFADPIVMMVVITLIAQLDRNSPLNSRNYSSAR